MINSSNAPNISVDMVKSFQIYENFKQRYPSTHLCKIKLEDGRKVKTGIDGPEIYLLIQAIAKEKITFKRKSDSDYLTWPLQTIDKFNSHEHDWEYILGNIYSDHSSLPEKILLNLFEKNQAV